MGYKYPRQPKYELTVRRSKSGLGLFAEQDIPQGEFVVEYWGPVLNIEETDAKGGKYLFEIDDEYTIDGSSRENIARYMNHSCQPNCEPEIEGRRVFVEAIRDITAGEELTYDYGKDYFNHYIKPYGCKCGHHRNK